MRTRVRPLLSVFAIVLSTNASAAPLGSGFTYQGQLKENNVLVDGTRHIRFSLWDAVGSGSPPAGGNQLGTRQILTNVPIANGLFTVVLNAADEFGPTAFRGDARWLQIEVCPDATCSSPPSVLAPRQPITAVPYAGYSIGPWQTSGSSVSFTGGRVGIATTNPGYALDVAGEINSRNGFVAASGYTGSSGTILSVPHYSRKRVISTYWDGTNGDFVDIEVPGNDDLGNRLRITSRGRVGIGTQYPSAALDVRGNIKLGSSSQYFVPGGDENLRIVRGTIDKDGVTIRGSGFSSYRTPLPYSTINVVFLPAFSAPPTVTVSPVNDSFYNILTTARLSFVSELGLNIQTLRGRALNPGDVTMQVDLETGVEFIAVGPR